MNIESYFQIKRKLSFTFYVILTFFSLSCLFLIGVSFEKIIPSFSLNEKEKKGAPISLVPSFAKFDFGPLSISRNENMLPLPNIEEQISLISLNDRPDSGSLGNTFLLYLKNTKEKRAMNIGQRAYLSFRESEDMELKFDMLPSPLWLKIEKGDELPSLQIGFDLIDEAGERLIESKKNVKLVLHQKLANIGEIEDAPLSSFIAKLNKMKGYLPDKLYEIYADDDPLKGKFRLMQETNLQKELFFIEEGDLFYLEGEKIILDKDKQHPDLPVARIEALSPSFVCIKAWDRSGLEKCILNVEIENPAPFESKIEDSFKRLRKRTATTVSCLMGAKKTQLKMGDWALHNKLGWKVLHAQKEMLDCIHYKLEGDLFVFDGVKKENGSYYFHGCLFDKTRSLALKISIPLVEGKNKALKESVSTTEAHFDADDVLNGGPPLETATDSLGEFDYFDFDF